MANPTDHLTAVRAALDLMLRVWPGSLDVRRFVDDTGNDAAAVIDRATGETIATCDNEDRDDHATPVEDARTIIAIRNAAPAIADLCREVEALRTAMRTISGIRDSIIGAQAVNWSEHVYPLVAALDGAGFRGVDYETARANLGTLLERIATLEAELAQARAHRCGGIVLSAEDADRIAALLEEQPGPTPAMLALFAKDKE